MLSQWCSTPHFNMLELLPDGGEETYQVSGHMVCLSNRWHTINHWDCCFGDNEAESWGCTCECHEGQRGRFGATWEEIVDLRHRPEFQARLERIFRRNLDAQSAG